MSNLKFNPRTITLLMMILVITALRLLVTFNAEEFSFANFTSIGAVAIFGAAYFNNTSKSFAFPLLSLLISDLILSATLFSNYSNGFLYEGWYWTYIAFAMMVLVSKFILKNVNVTTFLGSSLAVVFIHWIVTDLGPWLSDPRYTKDISGYVACLINAIPFELNFLKGTLIYGALMMGSFELLKMKFPVLKLQKHA